ncbi:MAG: nucleoside recognition domain-containing protein [Verrucomicrobiales bacterium]|nr:nucleoside recognition domain-containing protein [Verrucomicrobiales bacterium]
MLNWIWMGMIVVGVIVAGIMGRFTGENGIVEGMFAAVKTGVVGIVIPTSAMMMFFLGIMRLAETSGMMDLVARAFRPLMKWLFPEVPAEHPAMGAMVMNFAANFLGLGNAATPLGLKAMQHLDELNPIKGTATNPMCTFLAINTSSVTLIPATAMAMLAAQGVSEPYAIVGTTLLASIFSTAIAILAVKTFEKMPVFNRAAALPDEDGGGDSPVPAVDAASRPLSKRATLFLGGVVLIFAGIVYLETFPEQRVALQESIGLREAVLQLETAPKEIEPKAEAGEPPLWQRSVSALSVVAIPFILVFFLIYAALKRVPVYEEFVEGAKEGWAMAVRIMPFIVAMLAALAILRNSGTLMLLQDLLRPALEWVSFPVDLLPMALMRPLSGSGSQGVLAELLANETVPNLIKYMAATMYGSSETTFYVLAVYFGSVAVRRTRHALAAGLVADVAGVVSSVVICQLMFG